MTSSATTLPPAMLFAALSGPFDPQHALQQLDATEDVQTLAMAASRLADTCDTSPAGLNSQWLMRTAFRHSLLQSLNTKQLAAAVAARRQLDPDPETAELLGALLDEAPLDRTTIQARLVAPADPAQLERIIVALDRAGEHAPARDLLPIARSALSEFHRGTRRQLVAERGFFGREDELSTIKKWLAHPVREAPVACLFITGAPGIGKSSLLAEAVRRYYQLHQPLLLRLDFDRAGLDVRDALGLTQEAARQLAEQLGEAGTSLLQARLQAGLVEEHESSERINFRQQFPARLADEIGSAVGASKRTVLVVLDTLEVLRGRGETHPTSLFQWLDSLVRRGAAPMALLAAGRGDALDSLSETDQRPVAKRGPAPRKVSRVAVLPIYRLDEAAAITLLEQMHVPMRDQAELLDIGDGSPLKLRLAAEIVKRTDVEYLRKHKHKRDGEVSSAFLYRLLLSRIEDPILKALAHPGLIVRRINSDVILQVLSPALGLKPPSPERAKTLLDQLASYHWLVEPDPGAAGFLKHRSDMRRLLLPLLYQSAPARSAKVDAAAVRWFGARPEPWAQVEAVYHQLQLTRRGRPVPTVSAQLAAQFDADALDELPTRAADVVRRTRGQRTNQFRDPLQPGDLQRDDKLLEEELLALIRRQDWQEGAFIIRRVVEQGALDPRSLAADAVRTFLWRSGQWAEARRWLQERNTFDRSDEDLPNLPATIAMARLEMRAEFAPETLRRSSPIWRAQLLQFYRTGNNATGSSARQGALALVFRSIEDDPERLPPHGDKDDSEDAAVAALNYWSRAHVYWSGLPESGAVQRTRERAKRRLAEAGIVNVLSIRDIPFGSVLASLTPYAACVTNHIIARQREDVQNWARTATAVLSEGAWTMHPRLRFERTRDTDSLTWLTNAGLFAEWLQATTFVHPDRDLALIARSAERWRRTIAGDWSYGRRPGQWRDQPVLDETLTLRLRLLMDARAPVEAALQQIDMWGAALSCPTLRALLQTRFPAAIREARSAQASGTTPNLITRQLLTRGAPAAIAPALAVLIEHRAL